MRKGIRAASIPENVCEFIPDIFYFLKKVKIRATQIEMIKNIPISSSNVSKTSTGFIKCLIIFFIVFTHLKKSIERKLLFVH